MIENRLSIEGMACGMCEAHICDTIRKAFPEAKNVKASFRKKEAVFLTDGKIQEDKLRDAIEKTGYHYISLAESEYQKKSFFDKFFK